MENPDKYTDQGVFVIIFQRMILFIGALFVGFGNVVLLFAQGYRLGAVILLLMTFILMCAAAFPLLRWIVKVIVVVYLVWALFGISVGLLIVALKRPTFL
jgi:hypothetical protein